MSETDKINRIAELIADDARRTLKKSAKETIDKLMEECGFGDLAIEGEANKTFIIPLPQKKCQYLQP